MQFAKILCRIQCLTSVVVAFLPLHSFAGPIAHAVPLDPDHWNAPNGGVEFTKQEGFPEGLMNLKSPKEGVDPVAVLKGVDFESGTIEFDVKPDAENWPTVRFHQISPQVAEEFYVRPSQDCAASDDCTQYAPIFNGRMLWDSYLEYQHSAPFRLNEWNHIKMVISGRRMNVYFNREAAPSLQVGELLGESKTGAIEFQGPATFANIAIRPAETEGLSVEPTLDPSLAQPGYLRHWLVTAPRPVAEDRDPILSDAPGTDARWTRVDAERFGMVNLARLNGPAATREVPMVAWLKTTVQSDRKRLVHTAIGFARRVVVFVNGQLVYSGHNLYNTESERKMPDGRLNISNDTFELPLRAGANEILVGLSSNSRDMRDQYSYGLEMRIDQPKGLGVQK